MAKLNVVIPAAGVIIDGVEYRKVDRPARKGDVVKALESGTDIGRGDFIAVKHNNTGVYFVDNGGDKRWSQLADFAERYEVYEKVTKEPEKPARLTVGDYARVIGRQYHNYAKGSVVRIVKDARDHHPYKAEKADGSVGNWLFESEVERATEAEFLEQRKPVQPDKPEASDEIVVHEGRSYRKVSRKANVGERIRIVNAKVAIGYGNGDVLTVEDTSNSSGVFATTSEGKTCGVWHSEYVVLTEETPNSAKPSPQVGNYVRVTATDEGLDAGTIAKITEDDGSSTWRYRCEALIGEDYDWLDAGDFEVLTAEEAEKAAETAKWAAIGRKVDEYKVGDVVTYVKKNGETGVGTVEDAYETVIGVRHGAQTWTSEKFRGVYFNEGDTAELIVPVEQRFDSDSRFDRR